jgi:hypothetical protein
MKKTTSASTIQKRNRKTRTNNPGRRARTTSSSVPRTASDERATAFIPDPREIHQRVPDYLAEYLGEGFIQSVTSGNDIDPDVRDAIQMEELGGPFLETDADTEFGQTQSSPDGDKPWEGPTLPEAFPTALRAEIDPARTVDDPVALNAE